MRSGHGRDLTATAPEVLSHVTVSAAFEIGAPSSLTVVSFLWSGGVGASGAASAPSGAPRVSLTATATGSLVYGAGNDWDGDVARTPAAGQDVVHEALMASGDTRSGPNRGGPGRRGGTLVELTDTEPTDHQWNFAAIEIVPLSAPTITWASPAAIVYGTPLVAAQLNASVSEADIPVPGTFTYTPAPGTVLGVGVNQTLTVIFTPADQNRYATATATAQITVNPAALTVTAQDQTKTYGATNPAFTLSYSGFVNDDTAASLATPPTVATVATVASAVGTYPITVSGAVSAN
jgi:hypothetical protein